MAASKEQPSAVRSKLKPGTVYKPVDWEPADAAALQALVAGTAEPAQQRRALDWIMMKAAATYDFHYHDSDRDTAFGLGRAFVGQQIRKLLQLNISRETQGGSNA